MEVRITQEDLSKADCGGGYREVKVNVFVDDTLPLIRQKLIVAYEILSAYLDPNEHSPEYMDEIAQAIVEGFDQLEAEK